MYWTDTTKISAPASVVWRLTTDVADWPSLTPTVQSVELLDPGAFRVGSRARIKQPAQRPAVWTVTRLEPDRVFAWRTIRRGLTLIGTHQVVPDGAGSRNILQVEATGFLARPFGLLAGPAVRRSLRAENSGFKHRAEQLAASEAIDQ